MIRKTGIIISCVLMFTSISFGESELEKAIKFYKEKKGNVTTKEKAVDYVGLTGLSNIKDEDLKYIAFFTELQIANLGGTSLTSEGLIYLSGLKKLEALDLRGTKVDDKGMKYLKDLESLEDLDLVNTKVSDVGIQELASLENLRIIKLRGTKVTQKGIDRLQKKLPDCYITLETDEEIQ
ncbi:MAG: hypothetical protein CVV49_21250 [Spirochaetae bacterium HGW-Spirochaetae-5]|nr:MAG: hypothetical protein CVV49_21250 [Spirochaetae bacterium HGW-Spirochaetae-5]